MRTSKDSYEYGAELYHTPQQYRQRHRIFANVLLFISLLQFKTLYGRIDLTEIKYPARNQSQQAKTPPDISGSHPADLKCHIIVAR